MKKITNEGVSYFWAAHADDFKDWVIVQVDKVAPAARGIPKEYARVKIKSLPNLIPTLRRDVYCTGAVAEKVLARALSTQ